MKKTLFVVFLAAALAAATLVVILRPGRKTGPATWYADWLPPDTPATVSLTDLNSLTDTFAATPLGRFLSRQSMDRILAGLRARPETVRRYNEIHASVAAVMTNPAFRTIFGDDAVLALLPPDGQRLRREPDLELRRSLVAFATSSSSRTMERLARLVMGRKVSRETVDAIEMTRISLDGQTTLHAYSRGRALLLALDPRPIVVCLRVRDGQGATLRQNTSFAAARLLWQEGRGRPLLDAFVSAPVLRRLLRGPGEDGDNRPPRSLRGMDYFAFSVRRGTGELRIVSRAGFREKEVDPQVRAILASATANTTMGLVTPQILSYYWSSALDGFLAGGILSAAGPAGRQEADARLRRELGISLARIQAAFGPQYGVILDRIVNAGLFPVPQAVVFVQVRDHTAASEVVAALRRNIARRGMAREESETVQGYTIHSWPILPGEATRPGLVLTDDMLFLANGRPLLRAILEHRAAAPLPPEVTRAMGGEMSRSFGRANTGALLLRPARLAVQVEPAAGWLARLASSNGIGLQPLNRELLALMRSLEIAVAAGRVGKNSASSEILFRNTLPGEAR